MTNVPQKLTNAEQARAFLELYDTFLFDCDGVLWLGTHLLPLVVETLGLLKSLGKKTYFVTNNSTKSRKDYSKKFAGFGLEVSPDQIFTSGYAAALYVQDSLKMPKDQKVWVFGESGISQELSALGYESLGGTDPGLLEPFDAQTSPFMQLDPAVGAVIAGLDTHINYHKLCVTLQYLRKPEVAFVATNIDSTFPQKGMILPGAGSMIESVACSSGRQPTACGKPNQTMLDTIVNSLNLDRARTCMVGDRLNTDMKFGNDGGLGTFLVLTGIETEEGVLKSGAPKFYASKLGDLYELTQ